MIGPTKFSQALAHLLPQGAAWPRDAGSVWMRLIGGLAAAFDELHGFTQQAVAEWQPHSTHTRLAEWEEAVGLPDGCFGATQTEPARKTRVLARLRGFQGVYADSSPASLGAIEAFCLGLGYTVVARYNTPSRVGRDRVGSRLGRLDGRLHVIAAVTSVPSRCGDRVTARLVVHLPDVSEMACALDRVVPARFALNMVFV